MLETLLTAAAIIGAIGVVGGAGVALWKLFRRLDVIGEGVLGKPAVHDYSGAVIEEAVPSIQARVSAIESTLKDQNQSIRLTQLEAWKEEHTRYSDDIVAKMLDHILSHSEANQTS